MNAHTIEVEQLDVTYQVRNERLRALSGFELTADPGEVVAVVGESGSGKSTAVNAMIGLLPPNAEPQGSVRLAGEEIIGMPERRLRELRGARLGFVPQDPMTSLNPTKRIGAQVAEPLLLHRLCRKSEAPRRVLELLEFAGLTHVERVAASFPHEISGGMKQRVLIAAAFAGDPDLIIADEPTSALDVTVSRQIMDHFERLVRDQGKSLILITHDLALASNRSDRTIVMRHGEIVETGRSADILQESQDPYTQLLASKAPQIRLDVRELEHEASSGAPVERPVVLEARNLQKRYGDRFNRRSEVVAVKDVSFAIRSGTTLALIGESGSGKTTTARMCLRLEEASSGSVSLLGQDITHARGTALRDARRRMQVVYQSPFSSLDPLMTVQQIIAEPLAIHRIGTRVERAKRAEELLDAVGLPQTYLRRTVAELSGGQRQRIGIARALAGSPEIVVCDEPVSALDVVVQDQVMRLLAELQREFGVAYLFISHDLALVSSFADEVAILNDGTIVEHGPAASVFADPQDEYTQKLLDAAIHL